MGKEELEKLSTEELKALLAEKKKAVATAEIMQLGIKVTLNSAYGMLGNEYSRYYDVRMAEAITVSGQLSIRWIERKLNEYLRQFTKLPGETFVVAGDTDSVYITVDPIVRKNLIGVETEKVVSILDRFCQEKLEPFITKSYQELADYVNAYAQKMLMKREVIASRGLWRAKKNYVLDVWNKEGVAYTEPKLKVMGIESVRSSTPAICRDAIKSGLEVLMREDETTMQKYISAFRKKFFAAGIVETSFPRGISDIGKWKTAIDNQEDLSGVSIHELAVFKSRTPIHVCGALLYNRLLKHYGLTFEYPPIKDGEKIKFTYLRKNNPYGYHAISYNGGDIPPQFGVDKYVDKKLQYEKAFLSPMKSLLDIVGWTHVKVTKLSGLFKK